MADVFLSYANVDRAAASAIAKSLSSRGWSVWWDRAIRPGEDFDEAIENQLNSAHCVVVIWSAVSVASRWVRAEATEALKQGKLIPVLLDSCRPPLVFRQVHVISLQSRSNLEEDPALNALREEVAARLARVDELRRLPTGVALDRNQTQDGVEDDPCIAVRNELVSAFLDGAGLDPHAVEAQRVPQFFREIGAMFRESLQGAANFLRAYSYLKAELRIDQTIIVPRANNPLKFLPSYQEIAQVLLFRQNDAFLSGPAAMKQAMDDVQANNLAQLAAMRASLLKVFELLDPGLIDRESDARYGFWWRLRRHAIFARKYREAYASLVDAFNEGEGAVFQTYARTYREQMHAVMSDSEGRSQANEGR